MDVNRNEVRDAEPDPASIDPVAIYSQFMKEQLEIELTGETVCYGDRVYQSSVGAGSVGGTESHSSRLVYGHD